MKFTQEDLWETMQTLGWDPNDDIHVEIGGTSVYEIDGAGTKWAPVKGTRKYNNCLLYTSPSPRDLSTSRMPSSA